MFYIYIYIYIWVMNIICTFHNDSPAHDTLPSKGKVPLLEPVRVLFMGQIKIYDNFLKLKLFNFVQLKDWCKSLIVRRRCFNRLIGQEGKVFANGPGDRGSIPGRVIPKILKMVLDTSLLNTQQYKVLIKSKVEQSRERSSALPYTLVK